MIRTIIKEKVLNNIEIADECFCDICGNEIKHLQDYYNVSTSHSLWGNNSIDSYEDFHICSKECMTKFFNTYIEENTAYTHCLNLEIDRFRKGKEV